MQLRWTSRNSLEIQVLKSISFGIADFSSDAIIVVWAIARSDMTQRIVNYTVLNWWNNGRSTPSLIDKLAFVGSPGPLARIAVRPYTLWNVKSKHGEQSRCGKSPLKRRRDRSCPAFQVRQIDYVSIFRRVLPSLSPGSFLLPSASRGVVARCSLSS